MTGRSWTRSSGSSTASTNCGPRWSRVRSILDIERSELDRLDVALDQCWDLLRQRRARRNANQDEADAAIRPASQVEGYLQ